MKKIRQSAFVLLCAGIIACSDDPEVIPKITITLKSVGSQSATEGDGAEFTYAAFLNKKFSEDVKLTMSIKGLKDYPQLLTFDKEIVIPKNTFKGDWKVTLPKKIDNENQLSTDQQFTFELEDHEGIPEQHEVALIVGDSKITIKAEKEIPLLPQKQRKLLEHWKKEKNIDLFPWIGKIPVKVDIEKPDGGNTDAFSRKQTKSYEGFSHITVSDEATEEKPLLVMTKNPFGMTEYLQWVFRQETIKNAEDWWKPTDNKDHPPGPKAVKKALGDEKWQKWIDGKYTFDVKVDRLKFNADKTITFIYENGAYNIPYLGTDLTKKDPSEAVTAINFEYKFELWDDLLELTKTNEDLRTAVHVGGSVHPDHWLTVSKIDEDDWGGGIWVKPISRYTNKTMTYKFNFDHRHSGDYDIVTVTYTSPHEVVL